MELWYKQVLVWDQVVIVPFQHQVLLDQVFCKYKCTSTLLLYKPVSYHSNSFNSEWRLHEKFSVYSSEERTGKRHEVQFYKDVVQVGYRMSFTICKTGRSYMSKLFLLLGNAGFVAAEKLNFQYHGPKNDVKQRYTIRLTWSGLKHHRDGRLYLIA